MVFNFLLKSIQCSLRKAGMLLNSSTTRWYNPACSCGITCSISGPMRLSRSVSRNFEHTDDKSYWSAFNMICGLAWLDCIIAQLFVSSGEVYTQRLPMMICQLLWRVYRSIYPFFLSQYVRTTT